MEEARLEAQEKGQEQYFYRTALKCYTKCWDKFEVIDYTQKTREKAPAVKD